MSDNINPGHYKRLPVEAIRIIESAIEGAPSVKAGYLHGQVLKYALRCWAKNGFEDLLKAKWYLDRLIDSAKQSDLQSLKDHPSGEPSKQPKPAFAVGDKVKFCGADNYHWLNGKIGLVTLIEGNRFYVTRPDGYGWFDPSELQPVEASK